MTTPTPVRFVRTPRQQREVGAVWIQLSVGLLMGLSFFMAVLFVLSVGYRVAHAGKIYPGVSVAGIDVSGLTRDEAAVQLQVALTFPTSGRILFRDGQTLAVETPATLGMSLDPLGSAQLAYKFGRQGSFFENLNDQLNAAQVGVVLPPVLLFDQRVAYTYLQNFATRVNRPVVEAGLAVNGLDVTSTPGQVGRSLNVEATLVYLQAQMQVFRDGEVPLVITEQVPEVMDASVQAAAARNLLSAPLTIALPEAQPGDPGPWQIPPAELAPLLRVGRLGSGASAQYVVQVTPERLLPFLENLAKQVDRPEGNARFTFNLATSQLEPIQASVVGLQVDLPGSVAQIEQAVAAGQQTAYLKVKATQPQVADTATAQQLNITQLVGSATTYFRGSSAARLKNVETAASKFHGLLVAPGETFSMGKYMGDVSLDSGYAEALIIYNGKTIKGVGGGVCQVSTTLFRAVFFTGFPVVERHAHAYRVYYYEQSPGSGLDANLAGLDATVYFPLVDFKFTNDTPYWLLMETYYDAQKASLTWNLYSTPDGRTVQWETTGPVNIVPAPEPTITQNPEIGPEEIRRIDYAADGADVTINRMVLQDGKIRFVDKFLTYYQPWAEACEYGSAIEDPSKVLKKKGWCQKP